MKKIKYFCLVVMLLIFTVSCSNSEQFKEDIKQEVSNAINGYINDLLSETSDSGVDISTSPEISDILEPTATQELTNAPIFEDTDEIVSTPIATEGPTATPVVIETVLPTKEAEVTPTPKPTATLAPTATSAPTATPKPTATLAPTKAAKKLRFRNYTLLDQHYEKHGIEMGFSSAEEYEKAAAAVVSHPDVLHKIESEDGDDVYYVESTNEFVVVSKDGYIRTYFNPSSGIKYYERQ